MPLPNPVFLLVPYRYSTGSNSGSVFSQLPTNGTGDFVFTRSTSGSYINSSGFIATSSAHEPRIFNYYSGSNTCPGFLIEPSAQNLVPSGLVFNPQANVIYDTAVSDSPAVGINSARITKNATGTLYGNQNCSTSALSGSTTYTISRFFKYDGVEFTTSMEVNTNTQWGVSWIQLINIASSGVTLGTSTLCTGSVENYGNGWYRVAVRITTGASPTGSPVTYLMRLPAALSTGQGFLTALPQLEIGSIATSYIPTTTAAVTRNADVLTDTSYTLPTPNGSIYSEFIASRTASYYVHSVGPVPITTGSNRIAITYTDSNISVYKNGAFVVSQSIGTYPIGGNIINLGHSSGSFQLNDNLLSFAIYDSTLSAADAISLTSGSI